MAEKRFNPGDRVEWNFHDSIARGEVEEEITEDTHEGGRIVRASADEPQYRIRTEKSGYRVVHKPGILRRVE